MSNNDVNIKNDITRVNLEAIANWRIYGGQKDKLNWNTVIESICFW